MRVLVIGAGAIGQAFGHHFQRGGAQVSFLVRPKYAQEARRGFTLYPLNRSARLRRTAVALEGFGVCEDQDAALAQPWDLVVLCISSVALRSGDWFERLAASLGETPLLALQAGDAAHAHVTERVSAAQVAWGMLSIISYQAPLPGESLPAPGIAYWFPPLSGIAFSGAPAVVDLVTEVLRKGGMPVRRVESVQMEIATASPVLDELVIALELVGWGFEDLRSDRELLALAHRAMGERWALARVTYGRRLPLGLSFVRPGLLGLLLWLAARVLPLDLERFFEFHYQKVAEQTRRMLDAEIEACHARSTPSDALEELSRRLHARRSGTSDAAA